MIGALLKTLFKSTFGGAALPLVALTIVLAVFGVGYFKGSTAEAIKCQAADLTEAVTMLKAANARLKLQIAVATNAQKRAAERLRNDNLAAENEKAKADAFNAEIMLRTDNWIIGVDDAGRLQLLGFQ